MISKAVITNKETKESLIMSVNIIAESRKTSSVQLCRITCSVARAKQVRLSTTGVTSWCGWSFSTCEGPKAACTCVRVETFLERPVMSHALITSVLALPVAGCILGAVTAQASASFTTIEGNTALSTEGLADFTGTLDYQFLGGNQGQLTVTLTNTTDASVGGYLTAFMFRTPESFGGFTSSLVSSTYAAMTDIPARQSPRPRSAFPPAPAGRPSGFALKERTASLTREAKMTVFMNSSDAQVLPE